MAAHNGLRHNGETPLSVLNSLLAADRHPGGPGVARVLFYLNNANMNVDTDQVFTKNGTFGNYIISGVTAFNSSLNLTTANGGIYDAAGKTGNTLVAAFAWTAFSASGVGSPLSINAGTSSGRRVLSNTPILSLTTPQGAAATMEWIFIIGHAWPLS